MNLDSAVEPDIVLPAQYFTRRRTRTPEHRLMIAMVQDAVRCIAKYRLAHEPRHRALFAEARLWLLASETSWPYSFECICEALDIDSDAVRESLDFTSDREEPACDTH